MYIVEKKPLPAIHRGRQANPITEQMRKLAVGESFLISLDDPNWTGNQVRNENMRNGARYGTCRESGGLRIGRVS